MLGNVELDQIVAACDGVANIALKRGEALFMEDDAADAMYVVKSGMLRIVSGSTIFETVHTGGIVGEMAVVEADMPRSATVVAGLDSELIAIDTARFLALVATTPSFAIAVMRTIARRLRVMNRRYRANTFD